MKQSLSSGNPTLVAQSTHTIAAVIKDQSIATYLVEKDIIRSIKFELPDMGRNGGRKGEVRAIRRLLEGEVPVTQLFEYDVMCIVESLAALDTAQQQMNESGTLTTVVSLIDSPSIYVSRKGIYAMGAIMSRENHLRTATTRDAIKKLVPMLLDNLLLYDILEVITRLAGEQYYVATGSGQMLGIYLTNIIIQDTFRVELAENGVAEAVISALKQQTAEPDLSNTDNALGA
ncbi:hypothetical protein FS749_013957 [Ceratobasidium sp. UAMH 11750]|nr:hypothetical protein FS749_013957 [Ceratobasidium sp. UAMH 11750]